MVVVVVLRRWNGDTERGPGYGEARRSRLWRRHSTATAIAAVASGGEREHGGEVVRGRGELGVEGEMGEGAPGSVFIGLGVRHEAGNGRNCRRSGGGDVGVVVADFRGTSGKGNGRGMGAR